MANLFSKAVGWVKANPGYAIGGAGGVGFIGYLVYKQQQSARQTASGASGTQATDATSQFAGGDLNATPSYDYLYGYYQGNPPDTTSSLDTQTGGSSGGTTGGSSGGSNGGIVAPGPSGGVNSGNSSPIVAGAQSLRQIAMQYGETLQQLYQDNVWLGMLGGDYSAGKNYNPDLPGNVQGKTLIVRSGTGIGFGFIRSGWHRIINHQALWSTDLAEGGVN
jgi:hypothetical protein